ncbi:hypothetical protein IAE37_002203 [Pseudomonas sp. S31]|nr:hypothetical protein [Pseudomonas sp. S31]
MTEALFGLEKTHFGAIRLSTFKNESKIKGFHFLWIAEKFYFSKAYKPEAILFSRSCEC